jgi:hypothetical protein
MLNGMERRLEKQLPESDGRRPQSPVRGDSEYDSVRPTGFPEP